MAKRWGPRRRAMTLKADQLLETEPQYRFSEISLRPTPHPWKRPHARAASSLSPSRRSSEIGIPASLREKEMVGGRRPDRVRGKAILDWIADEARRREIGRLFLESGVRNERAHHLFEHEGFHVVSVVMMRSL